jgi:recombination protein RecT
MNTLATTQPRDLKSIIASPAMQSQFAAALPKHLSAERFGRIAITALTRTPKLKECTQESVFKCLLDLSAMGLEPDGRHAHLIPYGKECTLIIDYKGLVALVRRSGEVAKIHADIVCENDIFRHSMGEVTDHTFDLRQPRGNAYAAYAQVTLKDGSVQAAIMSKDEIEAIRKRSRAGTSGPWVSDWNEMAKKTAFRRLTKWLTISPELADTIAKADEYEFATVRNVTPEPETPKTNPFAKKPKDEPLLVETPADADAWLPEPAEKEEGQ